ncbi:hypothetical protein [Bacillus sp. RIT 809]|uniref:hypothetical protein n=1 Tax=Bacillus sp. RIT 809 TaxID=2803857 RepID=UPI00194F6D81|nr:hypothetical protein [Bacillus sp. RIT 809]MBM6648619.1 hypothetical protein [Bacillus sp. RIT 809]
MQQIKEYLYSRPGIGDMEKYIMETQSIAGWVVLMIISFLFVNTLLKKHLDMNLFISILSYFKKDSREYRKEKKRNDFYKKSTEKNFVKWQDALLKKIYDDLPLVEVFNKKHLAVVHKATKEIYYPFDDTLKKFGELKNLEVPDLVLDREQRQYYKLVKGTIRRPSLIGFELDEYTLNKQNEITGFSANVCQYKHTVVTSHILEYELFRSYKKYGGNLQNIPTKNILKKLKYRNKIHNNQSNFEIMIKGKNRHSLLSVQMIIIAYSKKSDKYCTLIFKRSEKVAIKPNYYHIIPAGGYEIFEKEETTNKYIIKQNFNIELALFRELIEEIFNGKDYEENEQGEAKEIVHKHPDIVDLEKMLENGEAHLQFLGNVTELMSLRPELSFMLLVDSPDFLQKNFKINFEGTDLQVVPLEGLQEFLEDELLYPSSAGLLNLAKQSTLLKERNLDHYFD